MLNYLIGLFHDIGKYQSTFQKRVNGENVAIEHSSCGAKEIHNEYKDFPPILVPAYCIIGHHTGIPNGGIIDDAEHETTLNGRLKRETEDYSFYKEDLKDLIEKTKLTKEKKEQLVNFLLKDCNNSKEKLLNKFAFITRYCFSCLVDADSLDAASFSQMLPQKLKTDFHECLKKVNKYLKDKNLNAFTKLQKTRSKIQSEVFSKRSTDSEIYLMNMPTGSGKTLCSVKYALEKAIKNNKERVIYVIPYNSIIDQTASVLESIFGESADILRHQSTFLLDEESSKEEIYNVKLATENWNADFIITTTVQFFESIYSNKRGKLRKASQYAK
ncbi:MAG: CRISPR-associated endonuclease Cas3'' [Bdellovibrionota bacterium]